MKNNQEFLSICKTITKEQLSRETITHVTCSTLCDIHYFLGIECQGVRKFQENEYVVSGILDCSSNSSHDFPK